MGFMSLKDEKWVVNDRERFRCIRNGYNIVTAKEPEKEVKWQLSVLKQFRDWVPIIKE